jgi:predicted nuclease of predicted toxin-antitoxin system
VNDLFISPYLDEDVKILVADLLRARGFTAITTVAAGNLGKSDVEQLAFAGANGYALLTHNRADFEALAQQYLAQKKQHHGLLLAGRRSPYEMARRLLVILNNVTADEMHNQIRYS